MKYRLNDVSDNSDNELLSACVTVGYTMKLKYLCVIVTL